MSYLLRLTGRGKEEGRGGEEGEGRGGKLFYFSIWLGEEREGEKKHTFPRRESRTNFETNMLLGIKRIEFVSSILFYLFYGIKIMRGRKRNNNAMIRKQQ